jgi:hypothetical protein
MGKIPDSELPLPVGKGVIEQEQQGCRHKNYQEYGIWNAQTLSGKMHLFIPL